MTTNRKSLYNQQYGVFARDNEQPRARWPTEGSDRRVDAFSTDRPGDAEGDCRFPSPSWASQHGEGTRSMDTIKDHSYS